MKDYKELIERLRNAAGGDLGRKMCREAADTIERLVKERDAAIADFSEYGYGKCEICKYRESEYQQHCKEIDFCCVLCEKDCPCQKCTSLEEDHFEWRGEK